MKTFGEEIKHLREKAKLPLRVVAAYLDIDQAILSKIENGKRNATKLHVAKLASYFKVDEKNLMINYLSDKIVKELKYEASSKEILMVAEEKIAFQSRKKLTNTAIINLIVTNLSKFNKVKKAFIFGSFARGDDNQNSDVDMAIEADENFSYFDLLEIKFQLEEKINRNIDIGFLNSFKPHILAYAKEDLKLIYER